MTDHSRSVAVPRAASNTRQCYISQCHSEGEKVCKTAAFRAGGSEPCSRRQRQGLGQPQGQTHPDQCPSAMGNKLLLPVLHKICRTKTSTPLILLLQQRTRQLQSPDVAGSTTLQRPATPAASNGCCWLGADALRTPALSTLAPAQDAGGSARLRNGQIGGFCHLTGCLRHRRDPASTHSSDCNTAVLCQWLLLSVFLKGLNKQETG